MAIALRSHTVLDSTVNSATCVISPIGSTLAGSLIVVGAANVNGRTVSSVTDNLGTNTYVAATSAAASATTGNLTTDIYYCLSANAGVTSVTITFSGVAGTDNKDGWAMEVTGFQVAGFDTADHVNNQTCASNTDSSASLTTNSPIGFVMAVCATNNAVTSNPAAGNEFAAGGDVAGTTLNAACSLLSKTAAAHQAQWTDTTGASYCSSIAAFKETSAMAFGIAGGATIGTSASTWSFVPTSTGMYGGSAIVVGVGVASSAVTVSTITDNTTNVYRKAIARGSPLPAAGAELWYAMGFSTSCTRVSLTLSATSSGGVAYGNFIGLSTGTPLGPTGSSGNSTNSSVHSMTEITSTSTGVLVVSFNRTNVSTISPIRNNAAYTPWISTGVVVRCFGEYRIGGANSTATSPWTHGGAATSTGVCLFSGVHAMFYDTVVVGGGSPMYYTGGSFSLLGLQR